MALVKFNNKSINLSNLGNIELKELKLRVDTQNDSIKSQIESAESKAAAYGEYSNPDWFHSAIRARKAHGRITQAIQIELSKRKKTKQRGVESCFVDIAKVRLDDVVFDEILAEAVELAKG